MSTAGSVTLKKSSAFQETVNMLGELNDYELQANQSVIRVIVTKQDNYYKPNSETQLLERIDSSLAQVDAGEAVDSETMEAEIITEFGL